MCKFCDGKFSAIHELHLFKEKQSKLGFLCSNRKSGTFETILWLRPHAVPSGSNPEQI